jgi:hypothetical protein
MIWISIAVSIILFLIRIFMERKGEISERAKEKLGRLLAYNRSLEKVAAEKFGITPTPLTHDEIMDEAIDAERPSFPFFGEEGEGI